MDFLFFIFVNSFDKDYFYWHKAVQRSKALLNSDQIKLIFFQIGIFSFSVVKNTIEGIGGLQFFKLSMTAPRFVCFQSGHFLGFQIKMSFKEKVQYCRRQWKHTFFQLDKTLARKQWCVSVWVTQTRSCCSMSTETGWPCVPVTVSVTGPFSLYCPQHCCFSANN